MRFSLRNQDKIKSKLGEQLLISLLLELKETFKEVVIQYEHDKYPIIKTKSYEYYVISQHWDVLNLAYKGKRDENN